MGPVCVAHDKLFKCASELMLCVPTALAGTDKSPVASWSTGESHSCWKQEGWICLKVLNDMKIPALNSCPLGPEFVPILSSEAPGPPSAGALFKEEFPF